MFKKAFFQIHWFLGITAGLVLSIMGVTGAIYSYESQILKWINQDSYVVAVQAQDKLTPTQLYQHFLHQDQTIQINSITINKDPASASTVNIVKEGARRGYNMQVNPYTAQVLPEIKGQDFFLFIFKLHRYLTAGEVGKQITGACTLILIFFILSGLYLRWPKKHSFKQWVFLKPKLKGRNFIWDLHAVVGTWVIVFYLIFACTGLYWSYDWWRSGMFKLLGVERPQMMQTHRGPPKPTAKPTIENTNNKTLPARPKFQPQADTLSNDQIQHVLTQTWQGVQQHFSYDYSSITLQLPQSAKPTVDINFVDPVAQHERARNKTTYNYKTQAFEKTELYKDKKLNEKIMSSMLPVHRGSFFGPIYQFVAMLASLAMPLFFVTGWLLYLKRRKQKKQAQLARGQHIQTSDMVDQDAAWLVVYASQTGMSEQIAWQTALSLQTAQQSTRVLSIQHVTAVELQQYSKMLLVLSTYGTGEAPDLASRFERQILSWHIDLSHVSFAVLALGSKDYADTYCSFGHRVHAWLQQCGAKSLFNLIEVNNGDQADIQRWHDALATRTALQLQAIHVDKTFDTWQLKQRTLLNPKSSGHAVYDIELTSNYEATWHAGDIAEIQPGNSEQRIKLFLVQHQIAPETCVASSGTSIAQVLWDKDLTLPIQPFEDIEQLVAQLTPLATREYSIANTPVEGCLRLTVRQQFDVQAQIGLGSGWLTEHTQVNDSIALRIRTNETFHLIDDNRPVILIGSGTGIAGLMSLLQERMQHGYTENWLFFGERQRATDFFYAQTIEGWYNTGALKQLSLAFSRDQAEKVYVQDLLKIHADEIRHWVNQGAVFYICGSIDTMASGVEQALTDILTEAQLDQLRIDGRYRRDVY